MHKQHHLIDVSTCCIRERRILKLGVESADVSPAPGNGNGQTSGPRTHLDFEAEIAAKREKIRKQRLAEWQDTCQEKTVDELRSVVDDLQRSIETDRVRIRDGEVDPSREPEEYAKLSQRIYYAELQRDVAWKVMQEKLAR